MGVISRISSLQSSKIAYQFFSTSFKFTHQIFIKAYIQYENILFWLQVMENSAQVGLHQKGGRGLLTPVAGKSRDCNISKAEPRSLNNSSMPWWLEATCF